MSKQRRTATGPGQKRFQLIGQSWHVKKTCSETVEQIIGGKRAGSADEYANRNAELLVRAYHLGPRRSLYCACYAMPLRAPFPLFT